VKAKIKTRADTIQKHKTQLHAVVCNVVRIGVPLVYFFFFSNTCGLNSARVEELAHSRLFATLRALVVGSADRQSKETEQRLTRQTENYRASMEIAKGAFHDSPQH